ncbi:MAG: nuclear transport factor 2 family protein [Acidobacteriota bacterium]|nr:nuclear transport factor 2 family protein [Acidobacteriota bacterium]
MIRSLDSLLDEKAVIDLTIRYAWVIDNRRFEDLSEVFAADGTADYGRLGVFLGPAAIGEACAGSLSRFDRTQHMVSNHQVELRGDEADGRCFFQAQHVRKDGTGVHNYTVAGNYLDRFVRTADGWRIAHRTLRVTWTEGEPGPPAGATASSDTSFVIAGWIEVDPDRMSEFMAAAAVMMDQTRKEAGNLDYAFSSDPSVPGRVRVFERWRSEADLRGHFETSHMETFRVALEQAGVRGRDLSRFHVSGVGPVFEAR